MTTSTRARGRLAGALALALVVGLAACGDDAAPSQTTTAPDRATDTTAQEAAAPTTLPEPAPGVDAEPARIAWERVDLRTDIGSDEWTARVHSLWELVPEELPIPMQWIEEFPPSNVGWGVEECHAGSTIGFGAYWRDADRFGQAVPMEEVVDWYSDEGSRAGWTVTAEPFLSAPGTDYEAEGVLIRFEGHGDTWIVRLIEFYGVSVDYCPAAR